ncbi:MAG: hypothetical protein GY760_15140 [Deltaproteobacteria bacterium]|nr:hypothetical protein [Deltaproteobacteria bacterium]
MKKQDVEKKLANFEQKKRFWYNFYLFVGVGICFIIHFTKPFGIDPGQSIPVGATVGLLIPLATMFIGSYLHQKVLTI